MNPSRDGPVRVMIVEDDAAMRTRFGIAVANDQRMAMAYLTGTGRDAIAKLTEVRPDVLLVDLGLPDMHGSEVIRTAARLLPECDIMVVTVFGDERNVLASIEAGATGYVLKDCSDEDLVRHILQLRAGGSPVSPGVARLVLDRMRVATPKPAAPAADQPDTLAQLTPREAGVLRLVSRGYTYAEVADKLGISVNTVTTHIKNSYRKLAVHSGAAAVTRASELGFLSDAGSS